MSATYSGTLNIPPDAVGSVRAAMESGSPVGLRTPDGAETWCMIVAVDPDGDGAIATVVGWGEEDAFGLWTDEGPAG